MGWERQSQVRGGSRYDPGKVRSADREGGYDIGKGIGWGVVCGKVAVSVGVGVGATGAGGYRGAEM